MKDDRDEDPALDRERADVVLLEAGELGDRAVRDRAVGHEGTARQAGPVRPVVHEGDVLAPSEREHRLRSQVELRRRSALAGEVCEHAVERRGVVFRLPGRKERALDRLDFRHRPAVAGKVSEHAVDRRAAIVRLAGRKAEVGAAAGSGGPAWRARLPSMLWPGGPSSSTPPDGVGSPSSSSLPKKCQRLPRADRSDRAALKRQVFFFGVGHATLLGRLERHPFTTRAFAPGFSGL